MTIPTSSDLVVVGGGPAGSTCAGIAARYAQNERVVLLEKETFPRYHIGESMIPVVNGVLDELGMLETLANSRFVRKIGITFVWGKDRVPWTADYLQLKDVTIGGDQILDVTGIDFEGLTDRNSYLIAWNVHRDEFDKALLDRSRELGADVHEQTRCTGVLRDADGAISGVKWESKTGQKGVIETPMLVDASGQSHFLSKGDRTYDETMNNYAVHGYFSNAKWKVTVHGGREATTVFICATGIGWIWFIPISKDCVSVGLVTNRGHFQEAMKRKSPEELFKAAVFETEEVAHLLKDAKLRDDILPNGKRVGVCQDWASWANKPVGPGWASAGDAAVFVDPILSTGVTLAMQTGHRVAYTWNTLNRSGGGASAKHLWKCYEGYLEAEYGAYVRLARTFYGNNRVANSWWWEAQRTLNRSGRIDISDRDAFTLATAGFIPATRAISWAWVVPLVDGITGADCRIKNVLRDSGVPSREEMKNCSIRVMAPFSLVQRAEPASEESGKGKLDVFYDIMATDDEMSHRNFVPTDGDFFFYNAPVKIDQNFAPLVDLLHKEQSVSSYIERAASVYSDQERAEDAAYSLATMAAMKGFIEFSPT